MANGCAAGSVIAAVAAACDVPVSVVPIAGPPSVALRLANYFGGNTLYLNAGCGELADLETAVRTFGKRAPLLQPTGALLRGPEGEEFFSIGAAAVYLASAGGKPHLLGSPEQRPAVLAVLEVSCRCQRWRQGVGPPAR